MFIFFCFRFLDVRCSIGDRSKIQVRVLWRDLWTGFFFLSILFLFRGRGCSTVGVVYSVGCSLRGQPQSKSGTNLVSKIIMVMSSLSTLWVCIGQCPHLMKAEQYIYTSQYCHMEACWKQLIMIWQANLWKGALSIYLILFFKRLIE